MSTENNQKLLEFLKALKENFDASGIAYKNYQSNGRTFALAQIIRKFNEQSHELLKENARLLPKNLQADAVELSYHFKVWTEKWDDLVDQVPPAPDKEFVFANAFSFPKEAADRLEAAYVTMKDRK